MDDSGSVFTLFQEVQDYMNKEFDIKEEIRNIVREIEQKTREIVAVFQAIHQPEGISRVTELCSTSRKLFTDIQAQFLTLSSKIPNDQYYRFHDHWRFVMQRLSFLSALIVYLESEQLISQAQCAEFLGVKVQREDGFHLDLDDFLMGLLQLASELSRLAINAVTAGDYKRPQKIARFMGDLDSGFRLLNLKNDALRKRFDGLKYDLQKVEGVVYDVQIRGLNAETPAAAPAAE